VKPAEPRVSFDWKYCECGCHCHTVDLLGIPFSLFDTLKGPFYLSTYSHHASVNGIRYPSREAAMAKMREVLAARLDSAVREVDLVRAWLLES
jgi:hypothetical protein